MSSSPYGWPLNDSPFSWWDRLKLAAFVFNPRNRWTQGDQVKAFEEEMAAYVGCKHAVFVSSGSTANTILAMRLKDTVTKTRDTVVFPSTTWTTSVAPFLREGFKPRFIDVNFRDLALDLDRLETYLLEHHETTAAVFITSLLGMCPNVSYLQVLIERYPGVRFWMDNCENTMSTYKGDHICSFVTCTTSTYYGHLLNSGEGGFVFTNSDDERDYCLMARNHGMTRSVSDPTQYRNEEVDARFDFHQLGNNFRNTDIAAYIGRMDLRKVDQHAKKRRALYQVFEEALERDVIVSFPPQSGAANVMFAIPLIVNPNTQMSDEARLAIKQAIEQYCEYEGIETRPVISGNLLAQTCYQQYGARADYPVSEYVHRFGMYVGLYPALQEDKVRALAGMINEL